MKRFTQFSLLAVAMLWAAATLAQDAVKADAAHYKVEIENDQVRVLRITYGPGEKSVMHEHPEGVVVFLTAFKGSFTYPDGKSEEITATAGQAIWASRVTHQPQNTGAAPIEVIQVEMKGKTADAKNGAAHTGSAGILPADQMSALDATQLDPKHYKVEFENDQVRVLRVTYGPGEKSVMHEHPNAVAVFLNDVQGQFTFPDGKTVPVTTKAGQVIWDPAGKHLPENKGDKPFQVIVVELKSKPAAKKD